MNIISVSVSEQDVSNIIAVELSNKSLIFLYLFIDEENISRHLKIPYELKLEGEVENMKWK